MYAAVSLCSFVSAFLLLLPLPLAAQPQQAPPESKCIVALVGKRSSSVHSIPTMVAMQLVSTSRPCAAK